MSSNWLTISLVVFLTVLFLALWESPPTLLTGDGQSPSTKMLPFAIVKGVTSEFFDETGKMTHQFSANQLQHFRLSDKHSSDEDYTLLEHPDLILFEEQAPWYGKALEGKLHSKDHVLTLIGGVRIWQDNNAQLTEFTSNELTIEPDIHRVKTSADVTIRSPYGLTESTGLIADLKDKRLQLLNNVRGVYEPL